MCNIQTLAQFLQILYLPQPHVKIKDCRVFLTLDDLEGLKKLRFEHQKAVTHMLIVIYDMLPSLNLSVLSAFLENGFDFTEQDAFGFTPLNYAIAFVDSSLTKESVEVISKILDFYSFQALRKNSDLSSKISTASESMSDSTINVKWWISSYIPFIGKLLPSDQITIVRRQHQIVISFSVHKIKKFGFNRRPTKIVIDTERRPENCLNEYGLYLVDETTNTYTVLNKKFSLEEKKQIITGMILNRKKRLKQKEGDLFRSDKFVKTEKLRRDELIK